MKTQNLAGCMFCIAVGFVLSFVFHSSLVGQEKTREPSLVKWEYEFRPGTWSAAGPKPKSFNEYGEEGWELVAFESPGTAVFKRPKLK